MARPRDAFLGPLLEENRSCRLRNRRTGQIVAETVFPALDSASRRKGLLGRDSMPQRSAIVIAPTSAIHTWFMRFEIDVAFVTRDGRIVKMKSRLRPWRIFAALGAFAAIELPGGALESSGTEPADTLVLETTTGG